MKNTPVGGIVRSVIGLLPMALALASGAAAAQPYVAGSVGWASSEGDCSGASSCDKTGAAGKLLLGYTIVPGLGVEAGYNNFGRIKLGIGGVAGQMRSAGPSLGVMAYAHLAPEWRLQGRIALGNIKTRVSASFAGLNSHESETHTSVLAGMNVGYLVNRNMSADVGVDFGSHHFNGQTFNVQMLSAGLTLWF